MKRTLMTVFALTALVLLSAVVGYMVVLAIKQRLGFAPPVPAWQTHQIRAGEDLYSVSVLWRVSPDELRYLNNLTSFHLQEGQILKIPGDAKLSPQKEEVDQIAAMPAQDASLQTVMDSGNTYTVKTGEDIYTVAVRWGISPNDIRGLNKLEGSDLETGQVLKIPDRLE